MRRICVWKCENEMQIKLADVAQRSPEYSGWNANVQVRSAVRRICVWKCENEMQIKLADVAQRSPEYSGWNAAEFRLLGMECKCEND